MGAPGMGGMGGMMYFIPRIEKRKLLSETEAAFFVDLCGYFAERLDVVVGLCIFVDINQS